MEEVQNIQPQEKPQEQDYFEQLQRLQAEFINYRTRMEKERFLIADYIKDQLLARFLEVRDNFERAPKGDKGMELIYKQCLKIFDEEGVQEITETAYDPELHEPIATREDVEEDTIVEVTRKGYRRNGRVLRPTQVILGTKKKTLEETKNE